MPVAEEGNRRSRRRGRGRDEAQITGETVHCDGLLDLRDEGYGFLRTNGPLPSADDVYIAARQVRQFDLRRGDRITGISRPAARSERNPALLRLDTLNGEPPPEQPDRQLFDDLTPVLPTDALPLAGERGVGVLAAIDRLAPVGLGSRGLLTASGTRSASPLIASMAAAIGDQHPDIHLIVLLISERPEDVTELTRRLETSGEVLASTFDRPPEEHLAVAELTLERTKRMAEAGDDVVILFDGLTRLARAYAAGGNGRHQPTDAVGAAVTSTLRFFGGARNLEDAGSITMVATARTSTGNQGRRPCGGPRARGSEPRDGAGRGPPQGGRTGSRRNRPRQRPQLQPRRPPLTVPSLARRVIGCGGRRLCDVATGRAAGAQDHAASQAGAPTG